MTLKPIAIDSKISFSNNRLEEFALKLLNIKTEEDMEHILSLAKELIKERHSEEWTKLFNANDPMSENDFLEVGEQFIKEKSDLLMKEAMDFLVNKTLFSVNTLTKA